MKAGVKGVRVFLFYFLMGDSLMALIMVPA